MQGAELALAGYNLSRAQVPAGETFDVDLAWEVAAPPAAAYQSNLWLVGPEGMVWSDKETFRPRQYEDTPSTLAWAPGQWAWDSREVAVLPGTPPGDYQLVLTLFELETLQPLTLSDDGRVLGTQVSVFDVSDPSNPERVDTYTLSEGSNSQVEYDHHAFLYWEDLAVIPVQQWWWDDDRESGFSGAVGLRVEPDGDLVEVERVVHPGGDDGKSWDYQAQILRSMVVGDSVYTISSKGLMKSALDSLEEEAWLDF